MIKKDHAICIRTVDFSETSQIVTFFTQQFGKIDAIAKGSKRPKSSFDGPIELLSQGRIVFTDSDRDKLSILTEFHQQPALVNIIKDLYVLNCCLFAAELIDKMTDDYDPHTNLFDSFGQFLKDVDSYCTEVIDRNTVLSLLILFQWILLKEVGLSPILNRCINCKKSFSLNWHSCYFNSSANGLLCGDCEAAFHDKIKLSKKAAACLADLNKIKTADKATLMEIETIIIAHVTQLLHKQPKMAKYILSD
jgi:DNA repair protein RecO (recombination protein O)